MLSSYIMAELSSLYVLKQHDCNVISIVCKIIFKSVRAKSVFYYSSYFWVKYEKKAF
jgi:hypothetical protein